LHSKPRHWPHAIAPALYACQARLTTQKQGQANKCLKKLTVGGIIALKNMTPEKYINIIECLTDHLRRFRAFCRTGHNL
jgi:hypothetical protein